MELCIDAIQSGKNGCFNSISVQNAAKSDNSLVRTVAKKLSDPDFRQKLHSHSDTYTQHRDDTVGAW